MERAAPLANRSYEDFDPVCQWRREDGRDTIELYLPGFRREHVRIQINHLGFMVISGEFPLNGTRRKRFKKEIELSSHCNVDAIHANFSQSILLVVMPKKIPQIYAKQERKIPETEQEEENETYQNMEFGGRRRKIEDTEATTKEAPAENTYYTTDNHFIKNDEGLTLEKTREIGLKFMVVIIVILVIVNYLADMSKHLMAQAQS